uniref:Alpha N-terminal protein methyltransferase 1 n=1 Tax=Rhodosorus marinus TaxID=101924 RepID=A0A7S3EDY7_9RHOD|mmetsp:Transcript_28254/g.110953  ORF Transcript_28254/g.110953 Transcript_28254/m.110953 type:complete len:271 (+) Transcript_28254:137-949(+)
MATSKKKMGNGTESVKKLSIRKRSRFRGLDTNGKQYSDQQAMWSAEVGDSADVERRGELGWYQKAKEYWTNVEPTVDGMLGGLGKLSDLDVRTSKEFIRSLEKVDFDGIALDVGGGIGRVSKHLLLPMFGRVDILESNQGYLEESKEYIGDPRLERRICAGMEDFSPETGRYSLIWIQWCIIYLTDADLVRFFKSCTAAVKPGGFVILKDNVCNTGFVVDKEDSSVTRSEKYLTELFAEAGVEVVTSRLQGDFPEHLFPVKMFALRAKGP